MLIHWKNIRIHSCSLMCLFWLAGCGQAQKEEMPLQLPDQKEQVLVEKNKKVEQSMVFVADTQKQSGYDGTNAQGERVVMQYGALRNTTEDVLFVEAIKGTVYEGVGKQQKAIGVGETVFSKQVVEPGGVIYYATTYVHSENTFDGEIVHSIQFKEIKKDPIVVLQDTLTLSRVSEGVYWLSGEVDVTKTDGEVSLSYIFLDKKGAVIGVIFDQPKAIKHSVLSVEKRIEGTLLNDFESIVEIEVHVHAS